MDAVDRQEYPAMLVRLQPGAAAIKLNERVKRINKMNTEIGEWLSERRKIEEQYAHSLRKLARRPLQDTGGDLGVFDAPWRKMVNSVQSFADTHYNFSDRLLKDVEVPLRQYATHNREMQAMTTMQGNLAAMAKELEDAQHASDKLSKKGGKASAQKVDNAAAKLQSAEQQWQAQAPFIYESLQAADESRLTHLHSILTLLETHEADRIERGRVAVEQTLAALLEVDTAQEIRNWSGRPATERSARQLSSAEDGGDASTTQPLPPPTPRSSHSVAASDISKHEGSGESKLKSRFGTMLQRRRQSIHGGFARAPSPNKGFASLNRQSNSSSGRPNLSPHASSNNLRDSPSQDTRLSALAESPPNPFNGMAQETLNVSDTIRPATSNGVPSPGMIDLSDVEPPPGPPPSHFQETQKDSEGFSVPAAMNDPISQAQQEAHEHNEPQFKLDIRDQPIPEQDADAQAALSNVANTLRSSQLITPARKVGTVRGRRDVRNTVYVPSPNLEVGSIENNHPPSPALPPGMARAAAFAAISEHGHGAPSVSDTNSIRSGHSLSNNAVVKHADMHHPGLNASIVETVSAIIENGVVKTIKVAGEIALIYISSPNGTSLPASGTEIIRINNYPALEAIGPNRTFIHPVSTEKPDEFTVDLASVSHKACAAFTYRVHVDDQDMAAHSPLLLKPAWKPVGDKLGLVIEYALNPAFSSDAITFNNLVIIGKYAGAGAIGCRSKPPGTHYRDKSVFVWRLGDITLSHESHKVSALFTGSEGAIPHPDHAEARWEVHSPVVGNGISLSRLEAAKSAEASDPFADESLAPTAGNWVNVETSRKIATGPGMYEARQIIA
ncbi:Suppressor of Profilin deletion [Ciborinia camelliae]|nr:Suppressor of Profilin deletion [Ciborinia camelliae]